MAEIQEQELVTKGLLLAFGTKCKRMFKLNPVHITGASESNWIAIQTSLTYNDSANGFDTLYLSILSISEGNSTKKALNSCIFVQTNELKQLSFAQGYNFGREIIQAAIFAKNTDNTLIICLEIPEGREVNDSVVDIIAYDADNLLLNVVTSVTCISEPDEPSSTDDYEQIADSNEHLPFSKQTTIGSIITLLLESTQFTVVEDAVISDGDITINTSKQYPQDNVFYKIFEALQAAKLSHGLTFQYDWENPIDEDDTAVSITNGILLSGVTVKIPVPNLLKGGATSDSWVNRFKVENGIVTEVDTTSGIGLATTSAIGGIKLGNGSSSSTGEKIWLQLTATGQAFIDKGLLLTDRHRDDLNKSEYTTNIKRYIGNIWLHIGETTNDFVNGYFYKCTKTAFTVQYDTSNSPYAVGTQIGTKLENYIYDSGSTLDLTLPFRLYVDTFPQARIVDAQTRIVDTLTEDVKINELDEFKLVNLDSQNLPVGEILVMTKLELSDILDITIKTTDGWDTALTKDYPQSVMTLPFTLNSTSYAWKQWDVQPRTGIGSALEFITNDEIDYLFATHVTSLTIMEESPAELSIGDTYTLEVSVTPEDADNKIVTWTSSDPLAVSVVKTLPNEAVVTVGSNAIIGETYTITCTSMDSGVFTTFTIIITT